MLGGQLWAYLAISAIVIVTPGPDTALTIRNTLLGGRLGGIYTSLGVAVGQAIWAVATSVGLVALLIASEPVFLALKYAGAAYLVWLGAQALFAAWRAAEVCAAGEGRSLGRGLAPRVAFRQGVVSDLANPKMAAFFTSLLPQFAPAGEGMFSTLVLLGLVFSLLTFAWLTVYAVMVARAGDLMRRSGIRRAVEAATGAVLMLSASASRRSSDRSGAAARPPRAPGREVADDVLGGLQTDRQADHVRPGADGGPRFLVELSVNARRAPL